MRAMVYVVEDRFPEIKGNIPAITEAVARYFLDIVYTHADRLVPVDTGLLKASGRIEEIKGGARLVYDAQNTSGDHYPRYVEYGTRYTRAQPFVNPALEIAKTYLTEANLAPLFNRFL